MQEQTRQRLFGWSIILPGLLLLSSLTLFPVFYSFYLSFFNRHAFLNVQTFVFLQNYSELLQDEEFWSSFKNGVVYALSTILLQLVVGIIAALIVHQKFKGRNFLRGIFLFPYLIPTIVVVILWKWLLNASYGLLNYLLQMIGIINEPIVWFSKENIMGTLIMVSVWQFFPFVMVSVLARLQTINLDLYKAAEIDGAPILSRFFHITLPQLWKVLFTLILLRSIWMFTKFDTVWLLAGSEGVGRYVQTLPVYTYRITFSFLQAGMGTAISMIMFLILLICASLYLRFGYKRVSHHES